MPSRPGLDLTLRLSASAADSRRGIVRAHPEALAALGLREWDAIDVIGARATAAVVAAAPPTSPAGVLTVDEVVAANCGMTEDGRVTVRAAAVTGAAGIEVQGMPPAGRAVDERTLRAALLGKVVRVGDSVTLQPRDLGPDFPTTDATRTLRNTLGAGWSTILLTVVATTPPGTVSIQPTTSVELTETSGNPTGHTPGAPVAPTGATSTTHHRGVGTGAPTNGPSPDDPNGDNPSSDNPSTDNPSTEPSTAATPTTTMTTTPAPTDLPGLRDRAEVLRQWLHLTLDRADLLRRLGAPPHLGVVVTGPAGVGKATLVRSVAAGRELLEIDGPTLGALEPGQRLQTLERAIDRVTAATHTTATHTAATHTAATHNDATDTAGAHPTTTPETTAVLLVTDADALLPATPEPVATLLLDRLHRLVATPGVALVVTAVRAADLDARLREPELCDRALELPLPDAADRAELLDLLLRDVPTTPDLDTAPVAERTPGYVAADLRALTREAALRAAGREAEHIDQQDLLGALSVIRPMSRSEVDEPALGSVTLDDVGDMVEVRQALTESVLWPLQHPDAFERLGVQPPRGVLLYGPPGCGKTFLVRALAASGRLTVHMVKGAELMDRWVGSSERAVRELFRRARDSAPSLVFLDEVDALAPRRGQTGDSGVGDRVVAALLTELDGAEPLQDVAVLAATNRPELLDPALLRPGRLERLVFVPPPDAAARAEILRAAGRGVPLDDVDLDELAGTLTGYSAADCAALLREAALTAMRRDIDAARVTAADVDRARREVRPSLDDEQVENLRAYAERRQG